MPAPALALLVSMAVLAACANPAPSDGARPAPSDGARPLAAYVVVGDGGHAIVRAIVAGDRCPAIDVDGTVRPMVLRAPPRTAPLRPGQALASAFAQAVCEYSLPLGARAARVLGAPLPLPGARVNRIVVLGDSGCRLKGSEQAYQDCSDPRAWPFRAVADAAAQEHPDLVLHVGDYHYRETPCRVPGCAGSPWGYGWDAWSADFFEPATRLLAAAPWVFVRGNHEECARAGQGWFRMLDAAPYEAQRSCDAVEDDGLANFSAPYAVALGGGWQIIVFDSARASRRLDPASASDAGVPARYRQDMVAVGALAAAPGMHSVFVSHHPVLGYSSDAGGQPVFGTAVLLAAMRQVNGAALYPAGVEAALHGHVHTFEALSFAPPHPATIVTGQGGDILDADLPEVLPPGAGDAAGVVPELITHARGFGYLVMERSGAAWTVRARDVDGALIAECTLAAARLQCSRHPGLSRLGAAAGTR
jgi:hypothetical protein